MMKGLYTKFLFLIIGLFSALGIALTTFIYVSENLQIEREGLTKAKMQERMAFESIYTSMQQGGGQEDINKVIERLRGLGSFTKLYFVRGEPLIRQFGTRKPETPSDEADSQALTGKEIQLVRWKDDYRLVRYVTPVAMQIECQNCHRARIGEILGVVSSEISLQELDRNLRQRRNLLALVIISGVFLLSLFTFLALKRMVILPLQKIKKGVKEIASGDLKATIPSLGQDEIGELGRGFEEMREKITRWGDELETKVKERTEALRESERRYRLVTENVSDVIWTMDMNFKYTYLSPSVQRLRGYSVEEAMAQKIEDVLTPTSLKVIGEVFLEERGLESWEQKDLSRSRTVLLELKCKDGTTVWTEIKITTLRDSDGQPIEFIGVTRDITERKRVEEARRESEERYRSILDNIEEGYFEVDLAGNFTFFNDSLCRELGYSKKEMMGMNNRQYMDKETAKKVYQAFNRVYATGESYKAYDWGIIRKDGTKRIHESSVLLMRNAQGERIGFRGIARDITEHKRIEEEREKLVRDLQKALAEVKTLKGIFPICASCKKIRDDKGYWNQVEVYIRDHSEAEFSHGICPECMKKLYGDILGKKGSSGEKLNE